MELNLLFFFFSSKDIVEFKREPKYEISILERDDGNLFFDEDCKTSTVIKMIGDWASNHQGKNLKEQVVNSFLA